MRLLKKTCGIPDLPDLGLEGLALKNLEEAMTRPYGIILVTGPTGSGKTTTLYSVLSRINKIHTNIMTLEDPVEYQIAGINQVQINPGAGLTFASGLRSFLRQDPNIILVGEIRDKETAGLAVQAALTGHLVFSTLHTNNASTAIPRLFDMEVESFLMASVLHAALAQRITRRICPHCVEEYLPDPETEKDIRMILGNLLPKTQKIVLGRGKGCEECGHSGYRGRVGIFELLKVSENISKMVISHSSAGDIEKQARSEGMITMKQDGYLKVLAKVTTIQEVLRVAES
ncbi:Flp pilus assembly complex ATPase component TadA [Candidatus Roizmanbacteria bacterium]|nr:Flp pilus assembly complex ATPase component TadA [Candidatus Roizmanbacteria bacterium]